MRLNVEFLTLILVSPFDGSYRHIFVFNFAFFCSGRHHDHTAVVLFVGKTALCSKEEANGHVPCHLHSLLWVGEIVICSI